MISLWPYLAPQARPAWVPAPRGGAMRHVVERVAERHGITAADILGSSRLQKIAHARQEAYWRCYRLGGTSYPKIGRFFHRDPATVLVGVRAHEARANYKLSTDRPTGTYPVDDLTPPERAYTVSMNSEARG